jgi:hypothetical protein
MALDIAKAFELPPGAAQEFAARSPWKSDAKQPSIPLVAGRAHKFTLRPFEVVNLEAIPVR